MQILSSATEQYLKPLDKERLGNAILRISLDTSSEESKDTSNTKSFVLEIFERLEDGSMVAPSSYHAAQFVRSRFHHGFRTLSAQGCYHERYSVPATDYSLYLFLHTWTGKKEVSDCARAHLQELINLETTLSAITERTAKYKEAIKGGKEESVLTSEEIASFGIMPFINTKSKYNPHMPDYTIYQQVSATNAIQCIEAKTGYAFYKEPGCGKTAPSIAVMDYITAKTHSLNRPARILVLGPKNIRHNWQNEIKLWSKFPMKTTIFQGPNEMARNYALIDALVAGNKEMATVVLAGYETASATPLMTKIEWDLVILDESHSISSPSTKRTKFCIALRDCSAARLILSGTPIRNVPFDLQPQLEFLRKGASGFQSFNRFKEFFGVWKQIPGKGIRVLQEFQHIPLLQERLAKYCFLLTKQEAMPNLPEKVFDIYTVSLTEEQAKVYNQIALFLAAQLKDELANTTSEMTIRSHLTKLLRLAEVTSGYAASDEDGIYRFDPNPKLETCIEIIKEHLEDDPTAKVQIWCYFTENIKQISARLKLEGIKSVSFYGNSTQKERLEAEDNFNNDPETKVFVGNPVAGGQGLNLLGYNPHNPIQDTDCNWVINYSKNWSSVSRRQSIDRAHRKGTRRPVRVTDLNVPGSIDDIITERVEGKIDMAMSIQDVRTILDRALNPLVNGD